MLLLLTVFSSFCEVVVFEVEGVMDLLLEGTFFLLCVVIYLSARGVLQ